MALRYNVAYLSVAIRGERGSYNKDGPDLAERFECSYPG